MSQPYLLGIDQGTSGSRALIIDREGAVRGYAYRPLARLYPSPDRVEQDPAAVAEGVAVVISEALRQAGVRPEEIAGCGIAGQRNTEFAWNGNNGRALANAITWQDLRTLPLLSELQEWPLMREARHRLGYAPGPYMAALHLGWRMRHDPILRAATHSGHLRLGLSAAWLLVALGRPADHCMDRSLVQAMGLFDFRAGDYWPEWLDRLDIPRSALPAAAPTIHEYGELHINGANVPVLAMIGDQQAALFGHGCRVPGAAECTQGTATFVKVFMGGVAPRQDIIDVFYAWDTGRGQTYCLEAPTTVVGAAIRWMRDELRLFDEYHELDGLAAGVPDAGEAVFVPAFTGLNAPYNDPQARGTLLGLTLGTRRGHIVRAFLEALGFQIRDILETIERDTGRQVEELLVGGGVTASDIACQIQADLTGIPVLRPTFTETTAYAAALLAGRGAGFWSSDDELPPPPGTRTVFEPCIPSSRRDAGFARWHDAIAFVRSWSESQSNLVNPD
jgi:glycerol kinase